MARHAPLALAFVVFAACGSDDDGALLTLRAPDGPTSATRIEIVLANADPSSLSTLGDAVTYFRQRETGGTVEHIARLDGFAVRVAPNTERVPDIAFIPFVLAYEGEALVGIGIVQDEQGQPSTIAIEDGRIARYDVTVHPVGPGDLEAGFGPGESIALACADAPSGIAWQRSGAASSPQVRLLFPLAGGFDATTRAADLDCDDHATPDEDCDDLRATFHAGAAESCDGLDTNCDGLRYAVEACDSTCGAGSGIQVCRDLEGGTQSACTPGPQCRCEANMGCNACIVTHVGATQTERQPCAPAIGKLGIEGCTSDIECAIEVIPTNETWKILVSADRVTFGKAAVIDNGELFVRAEYVGTSPLPGDMLALGTIQLAITQSAATRYLGVALQLAEDFTREVCEPDGNGQHVMLCSQL